MVKPQHNDSITMMLNSILRSGEQSKKDPSPNNDLNGMTPESFRPSKFAIGLQPLSSEEESEDGTQDGPRVRGTSENIPIKVKSKAQSTFNL